MKEMQNEEKREEFKNMEKKCKRKFLYQILLIAPSDILFIDLQAGFQESFGNIYGLLKVFIFYSILAAITISKYLKIQEGLKMYHPENYKK